MITIIFEPHSTTKDNEANLAAGWYDAALSKLGEAQARQMGERYQNARFDAIFCSDLQRSYGTAQLAFGDKYPIFKDERLRECHYGILNRAPKSEVESQREARMTEPFPGGESYEDTSRRMKSFLEDLQKKHEGKTVLIIGHRATQYGLERWVKGVELRDAVLAPWQWQPGWKYEFNR